MICPECVQGKHVNCTIQVPDESVPTVWVKCACLADGHRTITPYAGTSGHSGAPASKAAVEAADRSGRTAERQDRAKRLVRMQGTLGLTVAELREQTGWHHGKASAALTNLHKAGKIACLVEQRGRCHIYVGTQYVMERDTREPGRSKTKYPFDKDGVTVLGPDTVLIEPGHIRHGGNDYWHFNLPAESDQT
jgi:hypothetical protein